MHFWILALLLALIYLDWILLLYGHRTPYYWLMWAVAAAWLWLASIFMRQAGDQADKEEDYDQAA